MHKYAQMRGKIVRKTRFLDTLFRFFFVILRTENKLNHSIMTNLINDFLSQPLWLTVPLVMVYLALLAYFLYILWHYRRKSNPL